MGQTINIQKSNLDTGWTPTDELSHVSLTNSLQALVDLRRVDFTLNNIEDGDVTAIRFSLWLGRVIQFVLLGARGFALQHGRRDHDIFWQQETTHHIQDCGLADSTFL